VGDQAFSLVYEPSPSGKYSTAYWYCMISGGFNAPQVFGDGLTPEAAMADCLINASNELRKIAFMLEDERAKRTEVR